MRWEISASLKNAQPKFSGRKIHLLEESKACAAARQARERARNR
jgi:hypothetical protein